MILCLETSTSVCSVALCTSEGSVLLRESSGNRSHATQMTLFINEVLSEAGMKVASLEAIAVSKGPGSYTGLRIGVSVAKGLAYAASVPLIGVETTLSMFYGISDALSEKSGPDNYSLLIPMIDARRMEVYYSIFTAEGGIYREVSAAVITEETFSDIDESCMILAFGNGSAKCREVLKRRNIRYAEEFNNSASHMYKPAYKAFREKRFEDVAYFEPFYLKDFITSQPKNKISGR